MDKALNQLSVPLGQLREEVLVNRFSAMVLQNDAFSSAVGILYFFVR